MFSWDEIRGGLLFSFSASSVSSNFDVEGRGGSTSSGGTVSTSFSSSTWCSVSSDLGFSILGSGVPGGVTGAMSSG